MQVIDLDTSYGDLDPKSAIRYTQPVTLHYSTSVDAVIWGRISDASLQLLRPEDHRMLVGIPMSVTPLQN